MAAQLRVRHRSMTRTGRRPRSAFSAVSAAVAWATSLEDRFVGAAPNAVTMASWMPQTPIIGLAK